MAGLTSPARDWLTEFARAGENEHALDAMVREVDDAIVAALPEMGEPLLRAELDASTRAHWRGVLAGATRETITVSPGEETHDLARSMARRGLELRVLLAVYRVGQSAAWQLFTTTAAAEIPDAEVRSEVLLHFWPRTTQWLDASIEEMIGTFIAEREQWQRGALARQAATVEAVLAGQDIDPAEATAALNYPVAPAHTAYMLWVDEAVADADMQRLLERAAVAVHREVRGDNRLAQRIGARSLRCWSAGSAVPEALDLPSTVRCALGTAHPGPAGFRRSHEESAAALTVARRTGRSFVAYRDVELACLAHGIAGPDGPSTLVKRELGALAADTAAAARLRETALAYLGAGCDARAAGAALMLHPNTVRYRIRQVEKALGHSIDERRVYVELALHSVRTFGVRTAARL
ncbi:PucR family transcriptional regulator [Tsukamurella strandjordii]|uniref:Helix-turn-helix domain-containing protein n=1 Tax=Tsukamurella strandjordii TaxID=147577 RepID=A0AA90NB05_9ACTN|nr:helix-turn-helix domain-containing protein [Tsukamurella strandjordii]MDP0398350.1 helix-turn-helix domain-containing protein [Tsukamurella strandjordii]